MKNKIKNKKYVEDRLRQALEAVSRLNGRGIRAASREFSVPKSTLFDHYHMLLKTNQPGRTTTLSVEEEMLLIEAIGVISSVGVGISYFHICKIIVEYQKLKKIKLFINERPSKKWYRLFLKRWDDTIRERKAQNMPRNKALKRDTQSNDNSSRKRFKKSVGCVYTEDASRQQLAEIEQEKINRAIELENRKRERLTKKRLTKSIKNDY